MNLLVTRPEPEAGAVDAEKGGGLPWPVALGVFIVFVVIVFSVGTTIGFRFFWEQNQAPSRLDMEQAQWEFELKRSPQSVPALTELGAIMYQKGELDEAEKYLQRALKKEPKADRARYFLGMTYIQQEKFNEAEKALRDILGRDINNPLVYTQLAKVYVGKKDYKLALQQVDYVIEYIDPSLTEVHFQRGEVLEKMGQKTKAIEAYKKAASFDSEFKPARDALKRLGVQPPAPLDARPSGHKK